MTQASRRHPFREQMAQRILLVKLAALGDAVMASTLVGATRARWPGAELTWVAGRGIAPLIRRLAGVQRVVEVDETRLLRGNPFVRAREMIRAWREIGTGYSVALVAHADPRYEWLVRFTGAHDVRRAPLGRNGERGKWHGGIYAEMARPLAMPARLAELLPSSVALPVALTGVENVIVIAPGGARNVLRDDHLRRWPIERWVELTKMLIEQGLMVVAVGGQEDMAEVAACAAVGAHDLAGRTSLDQLLALFERAACVVTHDSGALHLAILVGAPTVALFGPTPPGEFVPAGADVAVLSSAAGLDCAPCYDGLGYAACKNNLCLGGVSVTMVAAKVKETCRLQRGGVS